jgi:mono/diheme cytochrome c family protein
MHGATQKLIPIILAILLCACATEPVSPPPPTGEAVFATHCASCHGPRGEGGGPDAARLGIAVPDLRTLSRRNAGEFPADAVARTIDGRALPEAHLRRDMPVWGDVFDATARIVEGAEAAQARVDALVAYLRELQVP